MRMPYLSMPDNACTLARDSPVPLLAEEFLLPAQLAVSL